jgi:hypothetical protein
MAARSPDPEALLATYEAERRPVAQNVLALTHIVFWAESSTAMGASFLRGVLAPPLTPALPWVLRRRRLVAEGVRQLSQLRVHYRASALSVDAPPGRSRGPRAGDRLPDAGVTVGREKVRLHELLARPGLHVLLDRAADDLPAGGLGPYVRVHRLTSSPGSGMVAVRPDGYVGLTSARADREALLRWLVSLGVIGGSSIPPVG